MLVAFTFNENSGSILHLISRCIWIVFFQFLFTLQVYLVLITNTAHDDDDESDGHWNIQVFLLSHLSILTVQHIKSEFQHLL